MQNRFEPLLAKLNGKKIFLKNSFYQFYFEFGF